LPPRPRDLDWDGCLNARDLGGHPTADGSETLYGRVVRADSVRQLSEAGWRAALAYGVRTVVDLRHREERSADPPGSLPVEVVEAPFFELDDGTLAELAAVEAAGGDGATVTRGIYLVFLERFRANVARAIAAVAHAPDGAVLVHCVGGKDRTGLVSAFLLHLAGVDREEIADDYARSEIRLEPRHRRWLAAARTEEERERLRRIAATPRQALLGTLAEVERRYGSLQAYLRAGGLGEDDLALARARLRG